MGLIYMGKQAMSRSEMVRVDESRLISKNSYFKKCHRSCASFGAKIVVKINGVNTKHPFHLIT